VAERLDSGHVRADKHDVDVVMLQYLYSICCKDELRYVRPIWTGMYLGINKARYLYKYRYWPVLQNILKMNISFRVIIGRLYIYEGPPRGRSIQFFTRRYKYM
jgi:hypothetical protein